MRKALFLFPSVLVVCALFTGCAATEKKFGRGMNNAYEIVRGGELRRSLEQTALFDSPDAAYSTGFIHGVNRSLARTGIGFYEMITAPFPPYDPVATDYLAPGPVYPDNNQPRMLEDSLFSTDAEVGFSGGEVAPMIPGSRFRIFDAH